MIIPATVSRVVSSDEPAAGEGAGDVTLVHQKRDNLADERAEQEKFPAQKLRKAEFFVFFSLIFHSSALQ